MAETGITGRKDKPLIIATPVPWSISTTVANLTVGWWESGLCLVRCDAFFGRHTAAPYKRVALRFTGCACLTTGHRSADDQVVGGDRYDWSGVRRPRPKTEDELSEWLAAYAADWAASGVCPNPHFYRVEPSAWVASPYLNHQHFIVEVPDGYAELLAQQFTWEVEADLPE